MNYLFPEDQAPTVSHVELNFQKLTVKGDPYIFS